VRQRLEQAWRERTPREQRIIAAGAALLAAAFVFAYLWLPMARERDRLALELPQLRAQSQRMRLDAEEIERLRASVKSAPADLKDLLEAQPGPKASELAVEPGGRVRAVFAKVRADDWLAWAGALQTEHGIRIERARIEPLDEPNMVKATAILAAGM
jgi:general secretion pathway protein M